MVGHQEHGLDVAQRVTGAIHLFRERRAEPPYDDKSRFLVAASHDLRQPIHALGLYVAELRRKISGEDEQHLLGQLERSVDAIVRLVDDLLDISRLNAGVLVPQKQPCDVVELLDRITADLGLLARSKNIRLAVHPFHGFVSSDPVMLERILMNLVSNALRYTQPNGTVLIACRRRGDELSIEVRDNGIGMDKGCQTRIFDEFVQLKQPAAESQQGLGLGLSIVDRLVRLLGHRLELQSAPDEGSTFALRLSLTGHEVVFKPAAQKTNGLPLAGKKLLIVDSDDLARVAMAKMLSSWGCDVSAAASLDVVQQRLIEGAGWEMVISEYQMGGNATGLDVIQAVQQHLGAHIPCMLIGTGTSPDVEKLARLGGHYFLPKPVKPAKLRSMMQFLLTDQTIMLNA